jgi:nucleotide-binding universal stress UspA family protein
MKYVIIPTDFSAAATNAMEYGVKLAKEVDAAIILYHVYQVPLTATEASVMITESSIERLKKDAEENLKKMRQQIGLDAGNCDVYIELSAGNTVTELEAFCRKVKPFAVVMGSKGHTAFERALFGSTTLAAIRQLNYPVIAVPPGTAYKTIRKIGLACDLKHVTESMPVAFIREITNTLHAELHILHVDHQNPRYIPEKNEQVIRMQDLLKDLAPVYHFVNHFEIETGINQFASDNDLDLVITIPKKHKLLDSILHKSGSKQILFNSRIPVLSIHEQ